MSSVYSARAYTRTLIRTHIDAHTHSDHGCLLRLSPEERAHVTSQLDELTDTYNQLCQSSSAQLQQLEEQLAREEERKVESWEEGSSRRRKWVAAY